MYETNKIFKNIIVIDLIIGFLIEILIFIFFRSHMFPFALGLFVAMVSFFINTLSGNYAFNLKKGEKSYLYILSWFIRVIFISIIALMLVRINKYYVISYILGYNCNILSLFVYALKK